MGPKKLPFYTLHEYQPQAPPKNNSTKTKNAKATPTPKTKTAGAIASTKASAAKQPQDTPERLRRMGLDQFDWAWLDDSEEEDSQEDEGSDDSSDEGLEDTSQEGSDASSDAAAEVDVEADEHDPAFIHEPEDSNDDTYKPTQDSPPETLEKLPPPKVGRASKSVGGSKSHQNPKQKSATIELPPQLQSVFQVPAARVYTPRPKRTLIDLSEDEMDEATTIPPSVIPPDGIIPGRQTLLTSMSESESVRSFMRQITNQKKRVQPHQAQESSTSPSMSSDTIDEVNGNEHQVSHGTDPSIPSDVRNFDRQVEEEGGNKSMWSIPVTFTQCSDIHVAHAGTASVFCTDYDPYILPACIPGSVPPDFLYTLVLTISVHGFPLLAVMGRGTPMGWICPDDRDFVVLNRMLLTKHDISITLKWTRKMLVQDNGWRYIGVANWTAACGPKTGNHLLFWKGAEGYDPDGLASSAGSEVQPNLFIPEPTSDVTRAFRADGLE